MNYCKQALELKTAIEKDFLTLGQLLYSIKEKRLYDPEWGSWEEYMVELKMSENSVNKLIQIFSTFILQYKIPADKIITAGGWTVISELLPLIKTKEDAEEWLHKAKELTREDLRKEKTEAKSGVLMQSCKHKNTFTIVVCRDCGIKMEDHEDHD